MKGNIREILTCYQAVEWQDRFALANDAERESALREQLKCRFAEFELSDAKFHLAEDRAKCVSLAYRIKVQGYTQRTGRRLFVIPDFFEAGMGPRLSEGTRHQPIYFRYPWSEIDGSRPCW